MTRLGLRHEGAEVLVGADADLYLPVVDVVHEILGPTEGFWCVEDSAGSVRESVVLCVMVAPGTPLVDVGLESIPVSVAAGRVRFPDAGSAVADPDSLLFPHGVGELGEASVLFGDDECLVHHSSSS